MFKKALPIAAVAAVAAVAALSVASTASAAIAARTYTWGDCTITVAISPNGSNVQGSLNVTCTKRHDTSATLYLKRGIRPNDVIVAAQTAGPFINSFGMGSRTLVASTLNGAYRCNYYRAIASITISAPTVDGKPVAGGSNLGTATVSTGDSVVVCT